MTRCVSWLLVAVAAALSGCYRSAVLQPKGPVVGCHDARWVPSTPIDDGYWICSTSGSHMM